MALLLRRIVDETTTHGTPTFSGRFFPYMRTDAINHITNKNRQKSCVTIKFQVAPYTAIVASL
jgi:hypothetical protein